MKVVESDSDITRMAETQQRIKEATDWLVDGRGFLRKAHLLCGQLVIPVTNQMFPQSVVVLPCTI